MTQVPSFDLALVGHLTRDRIRFGEVEHQAPGGAVLYGGLAARASGARVQVLTRLAAADAALLAAFETKGIPVAWRSSSATTTIAITAKTADGERRRFEVRARADAFAAEDLRALAAPSVLVCPLMRGELPTELLPSLAARARVALDVQGYVRVPDGGNLVSTAWPEAAEVLAAVHTVKADQRELELLTGQTDPLRAIAEVAGWGPREIVATHQGQILLGVEGRVYRAAVPAGPPAGRTGRGDTTIGAYLGWRRAVEPVEALRLAAALVAIKLQAPGPFAGDPAIVEAQRGSVVIERLGR